MKLTIDSPIISEMMNESNYHALNIEDVETLLKLGDCEVVESFAKGRKHFEKCLGKLIFDERTQTYFPHCKGVIFSITANKKAVAYETVMSIANFPDSCNKDANLLLAIKTTHEWRSSKMKLVIVK